VLQRREPILRSEIPTQNWGREKGIVESIKAWQPGINLNDEEEEEEEETDQLGEEAPKKKTNSKS